MKAGLDFVEERYLPKKVTLAVATFNQRALTLYQKVGFRIVDTYKQKTNGDTYEFHKMDLVCASEGC